MSEWISITSKLPSCQEVTLILARRPDVSSYETIKAKFTCSNLGVNSFWTTISPSYSLEPIRSISIQDVDYWLPIPELPTHPDFI